MATAFMLFLICSGLNGIYFLLWGDEHDITKTLTSRCNLHPLRGFAARVRRDCAAGARTRRTKCRFGGACRLVHGVRRKIAGGSL
jgi:hypothetical protein